MEPWQQGFELDRLKQFAGLFKAAHKHLVFGAFGLIKERDIADYLAKQHVMWTGEPPLAAALFTRPKVASEQSDFAQRKFSIPPGHVSVKAFAASDAAAAAHVLRTLVAKARVPVWLEIFEEDGIAAAAAREAQFAYVTTKISAGSEIKGVYLAGAASPLPPLSEAELATQVVIDEAFLPDDLRAEVAAEVDKFSGLFAQHYSDYNKRKSWTAFALRGYSDDPGFIIKPAEMSKGWKEENPAALAEPARWTSAAEHFPATMRAIERLGLSFDRVRFMRLRAKNGELSRHADITDREAGVADGFLARLHVPIRTSPAVTFFGWDARGRRLEQQFREGELFYLDQRKPHAVINTDPALDRVHLVMDCLADEALRGKIAGRCASVKKN